MGRRSGAAAVKRKARTDVGPPSEDGSPVIGPRHDLLTDAIFGTATEGRRGSGSLPEILAALGSDEIDAFTGLQAHQQHAWHAFLVQLAAIALHRAGETDPKQRAASWREMLLALTHKDSAPWTLVVPNLSKPAFMQPPPHGASLEGYGEPAFCADEIDVLVTSKNFDVKMSRIARPRPEHWAFALVTLQTMQGFSGRDNYGIVRMNGGAGSRPGLGLARSNRLGARFVRDVAVLLEAREPVAKARNYARKGGVALLWLEPWDGKRQLELSSLDPWFIEICRRIRLVAVGTGMAARTATSKRERVGAPDELRGNTGDPWTPVERATGKAFTASDSGLGYRKLQELIGDEYQQGAAQTPRRGEKDLVLVASVVPRGMGKTAGYHERRLPVPAKVTSRLTSAEGKSELSRLAGDRVATAADVRRLVLGPAILTLLQGAPERVNFKDERGRAWLARLDDGVDTIFFERLWEALDQDADEARVAWALEVVGLARRLLRDACDSAPIPAERKYRAISAAERVFEGAARNRLPYAYPAKELTDE